MHNLEHYLPVLSVPLTSGRTLALMRPDLFYLLCLMQYLGCMSERSDSPAYLNVYHVDSAWEQEMFIYLSPWIPNVNVQECYQQLCLVIFSCCAAEHSETVNGRHVNVVNTSTIPSGWTGVPRGWLTVWRSINILQGK